MRPFAAMFLVAAATVASNTILAEDAPRLNIISSEDDTFKKNTPGLELELFVRKSFATNKNTADVILINTGEEPITVLSKGLGQSLSYHSRDLKTGSLYLSPDTAEWDGHKMIESRCAFSPVTLKPGEATLYRNMDDGRGGLFARLKDGGKDATLTVSYVVPQEFGDRYGVWSGAVRSKPYRVVDGEIQSETVESSKQGEE